jgi:hypothetical protein
LVIFGVAKYRIFIKLRMIFLNLMRDGVPKIEKLFHKISNENLSQK